MLDRLLFIAEVELSRLGFIYFLYISKVSFRKDGMLLETVKYSKASFDFRSVVLLLYRSFKLGLCGIDLGVCLGACLP